LWGNANKGELKYVRAETLLALALNGEHPAFLHVRGPMSFVENAGVWALTKTMLYAVTAGS
jgi:hypothetical protein